MMMIAREPLAKSEVEIAVATVATLLVSASRMVSGEVMPNFEAIAEQNEMSFAQKRKDVSTVQALLTSENAVVPMLQRAAETIRTLHLLSEAIQSEVPIPTVHLPAKPLPEGSLLRDTLRRLHYVQKVVEAVAKWANYVGEQDGLKESVLYTKIQHELIRKFKRVVIQVQQAAVIIGKYRDMGDIRVLREMTLDAQTVLDELKEADENVTEKRKSISLFKRAIEESKAAPKVVRQLASVAAGLVIVVTLSLVIIKLNTFAPKELPTNKSESISTSSRQQQIETPPPPIRAQEKESPTEVSTKLEPATVPKEIASPVKREETVPTSSNRKPLTTSPQLTPESKKIELKNSDMKNPDVKMPEANVAPAKASALTKPTATNGGASQIKAKPNSTPATKKATNTPAEKTAESASPKLLGETEASSQKNLERATPKRKTIVIED